MRNDEDLISIVLPTYNGEKFIRQSIDTCLQQTYRNIELIIIDDCSTDNTPAIIKEYLGRDDRIIYHRNETNIKLPASLNKGFALARGNYLTWTSDDNYYATNALEVLLESLKGRPNCDLAYCSYTFVNENNKPLDIFQYTPGHLLFKCIIGGCFLYTRKLHTETGTYDVTKFRMEDYDYWLRASTKFKIHYVDRPELYFYRKHNESLTSEIFKTNKIFEEYKANYKNSFDSFFNGYLKAGFPSEDLEIHVKIFFNEIMKIDEEGQIKLHDIRKVFKYFEKLSLLSWETTPFDEAEMKNVIEQVKTIILISIISNMQFLNEKLAKQNPKLAKQFGKSVSWYYREYEVLPSWYKKIGHVIKAFQGHRSWKSLVRKEEE
jgi:glycosyltransferase involved in cell wall biosynthesis